MSAEIELHKPRTGPNAAALPAKIQYARALADSGLLPAQYRRQPANVLWAIDYGEMLGLAPMAAITGVHVIEGRPTASAGLISALVRRAGHKLRVKGDARSATCQIVRSDDPDFTFEVTWTLERNADGNPSAEEAGLTGKSVWKNYPASMLKSRAITQCARDACEEALFGLHYTAEELGAEVDEDGSVVGGTVVDEGAQTQAPAEDPWYVRPSPEQEWLAKAIEAAPGRDLDGCKADWQTSVKHVHDDKLTKGEASQLQDVLRVRIAELKPPAEAVPAAGTETPCETGDAEVVDAEIVPDLPDDWADKVGDIRSDEDAAAVVAEANDLLGAGQMSDALHREINAAVEVAVASLPAKAA